VGILCATCSHFIWQAFVWVSVVGARERPIILHRQSTSLRPHAADIHKTEGSSTMPTTATLRCAFSRREAVSNECTARAREEVEHQSIVPNQVSRRSAFDGARIANNHRTVHLVQVATLSYRTDLNFKRLTSVTQLAAKYRFE
jgi:hypothetical protein